MNTTTSRTPSRDRSAAEVLDSHLGAFAKGLDALLADYDDASVLITPDRTWRGLSEIGTFFGDFLSGATAQFWAAFELRAKVVEPGVAYITWAAPPAVRLATDTLVVRDGRVAVQTFTAFGS
ncbi:Uncharacterised protein [Xylophilus ampelinus]|nr:nuclear transport factor 2 family protein [Variovorax sp.]VTY29328.1 Uncharacterised protein [Xylophilus ampelinus]